MRAIILLNPESTIDLGNKDDHLLMQKIVVERFLINQQIKIVSLNPSQIDYFYTIPHALLYDLRKVNSAPLDCLIIYSPQTIQRFVSIYPEKWLCICKYFYSIKILSGEHLQPALNKPS